ncbi:MULTISPECIES: hypothetical protein [Paenibacillus]|uniref:hypothetical protein n=1 Tax=Paenibacillus TaxID=44249 RepID=UPI0029E7E650|nr:hypothetical protein [Paenibacillus caseinilyticus]
MAAKRQAAPPVTLPVKRSARESRLRLMWKYKALYLISLPGILYFLVFKCVPLPGSVIAFQEHNISQGFTVCKWTALGHFRRMFAHGDCLNILNNTLLIGLYGPSGEPSAAPACRTQAAAS